MYFANLLDEQQRDSYADLLAYLSDYLGDQLTMLLDAIELSREASYPEQKYHHVAVQMLGYHFVEQIDGAAVLARQGCSESCKGPLRSAFEGMLAMLYMLQADTERRGLAYQVAHVHGKLKLHKRCSGTDPESLAFQAMIGGPALDAIRIVQQTLDQQAAKWESMLLKPEFAPIEAEWQAFRAKYKKEPRWWYSLFGGPRNVETLAKALGMTDWYEILYRRWCDTLHVGDALEGVRSKGTNRDEVHLRPIRDPASLQQWVTLAGVMTQKVSKALLRFYGTDDQRNEFQERYESKLKERSQLIAKTRLLSVSWYEQVMAKRGEPSG